MTKIAVISTNDRVYGVNKSFELLDIEPIKGKRVVLKPNFNTADPPPASTHMDTFRQILVKIQEMGAKSIIVAERCGPANTNEAFRKKGLYELANEFGFDILNLETVSEDQWVMKNLDGSHWKNGFLFAKVYDEAECVIETCCLKTLLRNIEKLDALPPR